MTERADPDFSAQLAQLLPFAIATKKKLRARGLRIGKRKCPACGGTILARLAGSRNHLHMACDTPACFMRLME